MKLPELPKQKKSKEAVFGVLFRKWWVANPLPGTFELKETLGKKSISLSAVDIEQISFALATQSKKGVLTRVTVGTVGTADYIGLVAYPAWIVVKYTKRFYIISIDSFLLEKQRSKRKSLTEERADAISTITV